MPFFSCELCPISPHLFSTELFERVACIYHFHFFSSRSLSSPLWSGSLQFYQNNYAQHSPLTQRGRQSSGQEDKPWHGIPVLLPAAFAGVSSILRCLDLSCVLTALLFFNPQVRVNTYLQDSDVWRKTSGTTQCVTPSHSFTSTDDGVA